MLWNRLRVIASEDIGVADPQATLIVHVLEKQYFEALEKKNSSKKLFLVHAVLYLARTYKSRIVDDLLLNVEGNIEAGEKLEIPDYALTITLTEEEKWVET